MSFFGPRDTLGGRPAPAPAADPKHTTPVADQRPEPDPKPPPRTSGKHFRFPDDSQRITIIGKTGSGKTQAAMWLLSRRSYLTRPWIILDYKYETMIAELPFGINRSKVPVRHIPVRPSIPKEPGLYVCHPTPDDAEAVDDMLWAIWRQENTGLFIDEGYMIHPRSPAFQAILTQGRSKSIPVIMLTQRPMWVTRFAFSEADFIQLFQLTDQRDIKTVKQFMPLPIQKPLPRKYQSWWWDNGQDYGVVLQPVPSANTIMGGFRRELIQPRRVL